ncbi:MAG: hypothetical protein HYW50_03185 [Candidatus Diapherotrites archaeon]|nr:hypothetical protein [Candidatus Diapherotrites archaeon]
MRFFKTNSHFYAVKTGTANIIDYESTIKSLLEQNSRKGFCQIVPAKTVGSTDQVAFAIEQSIGAFFSGENFSKKPGLEFLIRIYGTRQIENALKISGLKAGKQSVVLACAHTQKVGLEKILKTAEKILHFKEKKIFLGKNKKELMQLYGITAAEINTLKDLKNPLQQIIIEKNALVAFEK